VVALSLDRVEDGADGERDSNRGEYETWPIVAISRGLRIRNLLQEAFFSRLASGAPYFPHAATPSLGIR
jgi:hypothetical protein